MWARTFGVAAVLLVCCGCSGAALDISGPTPSPAEQSATPRPVAARQLRLDDSGFYGSLFLPPPSASHVPAILLIGGSEGGLAAPTAAGALARQGFAVLSVAYFKEPAEPRLPSSLADIPIEYFATAARLLAAQPEVDPTHVAVWGGSRGSEGAALLAGDFPDLVHGAVLESPSSVADPGFPDTSVPAWTLHGVPVPTVKQSEYGFPVPPITPAALLPVQRITGPVVTICGGQDRLWQACDFSAEIARLAGGGRVTSLSYPLAGHSPVIAPFYIDAGLPIGAGLGGSPSDDTAAGHDAVPRILAALRGS